jgi:hypothetical protein
MPYDTVMQFLKPTREKYMVAASPPSKPTLFFGTTLVNPPSGPGQGVRVYYVFKNIPDIQYSALCG